MKKKVTWPVALAAFLVFLVSVGVFSYLTRTKYVDAAAANVVGLQLQDSNCGGNSGSARYSTDVGEWTPWAGDSDDYDPDCIKVYLGSAIPADLDIRVGIQAQDVNTPCGFLWLFKCSDGGGTIQYSSWASQSGNSFTSWASDVDQYDPDQWRILIDTQPRYGYTVSDFKLGVQVNDKSGLGNGGCGGANQTSPIQYTASSTSGASWSPWAIDDDAVNFNCTRANLISTSTLNSPTAVFTGTSTAPAGNSINLEWDVEYINTTSGCTLVGRDSLNNIIDDRSSSPIKTNGANSTTSMAITQTVTYTLTCPGFKTGTSAVATKSISPYAAVPPSFAFSMSPLTGITAGSTSVSSIAVTNSSDSTLTCSIVGYDTAGATTDTTDGSFTVPPRSAVASSSDESIQTIYITNTSDSTWNVPFDWNNSNNSIEVIGGGGSGASQDNGWTLTGGGGGGGGAYAKVTNLALTPGALVSIQVGTGGNDGASGQDTWFGGTTCAGASVCADGGTAGSGDNGGSGGLIANSVGTVTKNGGDGGDNGSYSGGGGGGAGGPNGDGKKGGKGGGQGGAGGGGANGGTAGSNGGSTTGGNGGSGNSGGGAGGKGANCCANNNAVSGSAGTYWGTKGPGGGGGGGADNTNTSNTVGTGGLYGGGGGGDGDDSLCCAKGDGAQGIIVIKYSHTVQYGPIYLYSTTTTWTVPDNWGVPNMIQAIGGGAGGGSYINGTTGSGGGGGGGYSRSNDVSLVQGSTVKVVVGTGGAAETDGGDTYLCNNTTNCTSINGSAVVVGAKGGQTNSSRSGGTGGASGSGKAYGSNLAKYSGGRGGNSGGSSYGGAGGGGAAGPGVAGLSGNGARGGDISSKSEGSGGGGNGGGSAGSPPECCYLSAYYGGSGGNNAQGTGGGDRGDSSAGDPGVNGGGGGGGDNTSNGAGGIGGSGTDITSNKGSGGGGGGSGDGSGDDGGKGALYGGGGGGVGADPGNVGGSGGSGIIVIYYSAGNALADNTEYHTSAHTINETTDFRVTCIDPSNNVSTSTTVRISLAACMLDGVSIPNGSPGINFYSVETAPSGHVCSEYIGVRSCSAGTLTGSDTFVYATCSEQNNVLITANGISGSTSVRKGSSVALTWDGGNAGTCTVTGTDGWSGANADGTTDISGTRSVTVNKKTIYTASCTLDGNTRTSSVTVNILPAFINF